MLPSIHHYKPKIHKERIDVTSQNSIKSSKRQSSTVLEDTMIHKREEMPHWESGKSAQKTMKTLPHFSVISFFFYIRWPCLGGNRSWWGATEAADGDESQLLTASNGAEQRHFSCLVLRRRGNISVRNRRDRVRRQRSERKRGKLHSNCFYLDTCRAY